MRTAGCAPRKAARLAKQLFVPAISVYPGNAKNSIEMLTSEGSTAAAPDGGAVGTATPFTEDDHRRAARTTLTEMRAIWGGKGGFGSVSRRARDLLRALRIAP